MSEVRVRFAPSPTGHLHVGGARTALFNYYFAKAKQGKFILRIEDTDKERSLKEHEDEILSSLKWLGLNWDEGPFYQSERESLYKEKLNWLLDQGHAYRCDCTPEEIDQMREAARAKGEKPKYNGRCRERKLPADHDKPFVVRFKAPQGGVTRFEDFIAGQVEVDQSEGDDFIIARSDGSPTYQFVVVVDDIDMGMTHVIRGEDHLSNTYKQVQLYEAFQAKASLFAHVPIILGPDKSKLSKRHGAVSLSAFKEQGILSEAMRNALVRLGWSHGDQELFTDEELKKYFDLDHCGRSAAMFDHEKLGFYNSHFFKQMNAEELVNRFKSEGFGDYSRFLEKEEWKNLFVASVERIQYMPELKDQLAWFESVKLDPELKDVRKTFQKLSVEKFEAFKSYLSASAWETDDLFDRIKSFCEENEMGVGGLAKAVRLCLTGSLKSPDLKIVAAALGKDEILQRLKFP